MLGGGGRGLGVVNLFALIYMTRVLGLGEATSGLMYGALIVFSVPMPLVAGWLSDRFGRKPLIVGVYLGGAIGFVVFLLAGSSIPLLWVGIVLMGLFSFAESPQLQALARRHRATVDARRVVRPVLHDGLRRGFAVDGGLRRDHRHARGNPRACRSSSC